VNANAIEMLRADHRKLKELIDEFYAADERAYRTKKAIAERVFRELEVHTRLEEEIFYPAVKSRMDEVGEDLILESVETHRVIATLIDELKAMKSDDVFYSAKFKVLAENVEQHIEAEEGELFPGAQQKLGDDMKRLGEELERRREQLTTRA
jgi:hemerythrin superfamily protein